MVICGRLTALIFISIAASSRRSSVPTAAARVRSLKLSTAKYDTREKYTSDRAAVTRNAPA
jgi:hypothetical protein